MNEILSFQPLFLSIGVEIIKYYSYKKRLQGSPYNLFLVYFIKISVLSYSINPPIISCTEWHPWRTKYSSIPSATFTDT